jgi:hypothetical protein
MKNIGHEAPDEDRPSHGDDWGLDTLSPSAVRSLREELRRTPRRSLRVWQHRQLRKALRASAA